MAVDSYVNPYDSQIKDESLLGDEKQLDSSKDLFTNSDMVRVIATYLEENVPADVKETRLYKEFWAVVGKKIQLTFLDYDDKYEFEAVFQQAKMLFFMSDPGYKMDFQTLAMMKQIEFYFLAALRSAIGIKESRMNERMVLGSTIRQNISSNTERFAQTKSGGLLSWMGKLF